MSYIERFKARSEKRVRERNFTVLVRNPHLQEIAHMVHEYSPTREELVGDKNLFKGVNLLELKQKLVSVALNNEPKNINSEEIDLVRLKINKREKAYISHIIARFLYENNLALTLKERLYIIKIQNDFSDRWQRSNMTQEFSSVLTPGVIIINNARCKSKKF